MSDEQELNDELERCSLIMQQLVEHILCMGAGSLQQTVLDQYGNAWTILVTSEAISRDINLYVNGKTEASHE